MDSHWVNCWPGYRCRHGNNSSKTSDPDRPKTVYLREDRVVAQLAELVASQCEHRWVQVEAMLRSRDPAVIAEPGSVRLMTGAGDTGRRPRSLKATRSGFKIYLTEDRRRL